MIRMELSENYAGVRIIGRKHEFEDLVEMFHELLSDELYESPVYHNVSNRALGVCYDIRHAAMGGRGLEFVSDELYRLIDESDSETIELKDARCSCYCFYPEMCYVVMGLGAIIEHRTHSLSRTRYPEPGDPNILYDTLIPQVRSFQSAFVSCMKKELTPATFTRLVNSLSKGTAYCTSMYHQYLDKLNLEFYGLSPEKRKKQMSVFLKHLAEYYKQDQYLSLKEDLELTAEIYGADIDELTSSLMKYPEEVIW